jgi:hypothetical protein
VGVRSLCGEVAGPDDARYHDTCVHPAQPQLSAETRVDKSHRLSAKALDELRAAQVRGFADPQHGLANRKQAARWQILDTEVQIDIELIPGQGHALPPASDEFRSPGVHHGYLPLGVGRPIRGAFIATGQPVIPYKPGNLVQNRLSRQLPMAHRGTADDQHDPATVLGRITDLAEPGQEALTRQMLHSPIVPRSPIP